MMPFVVAALLLASIFVALVFVLRSKHDHLAWGHKDAASAAAQAIEEDGIVRYTDIVCPARVSAQIPRFALVLRLTQTPRDGGAAVAEVVLKNLAPVRAHLDAPGFQVLGPNELDVAIVADQDSAPVVFELKPRRIGTSTLTLHFTQGGNPIGSTSFAIEVSDQDVAMTTRSPNPSPVSLRHDVTPPDCLLYVNYDGAGERPELRFMLVDLAHGQLGVRFVPLRVSSDPRAWAAGVYGSLSEMVEQGGWNTADFNRRLKQIGQKMWNELIPPDLKQLYRERPFRGRSLVVLSDEPHLPWELVWPYDASGDEFTEDPAPWCCTTRFARWLTRDETGSGNASPPGQLQVEAIAVLAPSGNDLDGAQVEKAYLDKFCAQTRVLDVSPQPPTRRAMMQLLDTGKYDLLHVASHGQFLPASPEGPAVLHLPDGEVFGPDAIVGRAEHLLRKRRPGFILNACHAGQAMQGMTRIAGWANRLVSGGASFFLAPMWTVSDEAALAFSKALYDALGEGQPIAAAVLSARERARTASNSDPTYLAYTLYAHPNARVVFGKPKEHAASSA